MLLSFVVIGMARMTQSTKSIGTNFGAIGILGETAGLSHLYKIQFFSLPTIVNSF